MDARHLTVALVLGIALGASACKENEGADVDIADDSLSVTIPEGTTERAEEALRRAGGAIGEAVEETGEAINEAGEEIQEEAGEGGADTTRM